MQYPGCTQDFTRLENLKIHFQTHTGEKPYLCRYTGCQKNFSNTSDTVKAPQDSLRSCKTHVVCVFMFMLTRMPHCESLLYKGYEFAT